MEFNYFCNVGVHWTFLHVGFDVKSEPTKYFKVEKQNKMGILMQNYLKIDST